jgi:predicted Rossmann fold nucleotide-binding protein DprA/Smf involved in DNA uptake
VKGCCGHYSPYKIGDRTKRSSILRLLASWKIRIDLGELIGTEREELMALSEAFLEWEQDTKMKERQAIALNLLRKNMSLETIAEVTGLTIAQLQQLQSENQ